MIEVELNTHAALPSGIMLEKRTFSKRNSLANEYKSKTRSSKITNFSNDHKSEKSLVKRAIKKDTRIEELEKLLLTE